MASDVDREQPEVRRSAARWSDVHAADDPPSTSATIDLRKHRCHVVTLRARACREDVALASCVGRVDHRTSGSMSPSSRLQNARASQAVVGGLSRASSLTGYSSTCFERALWHCRFTATGSDVMCVGYVSMFTAIAVFTPPTACGPTPSAFTFASSSRSNSAVSGSSLCCADRADDALLRQVHRVLGRAADADADDERRARVAAGLLDRLQHELGDAFLAARWQHDRELRSCSRSRRPSARP